LGNDPVDAAPKVGNVVSNELELELEDDVYAGGAEEVSSLKETRPLVLDLVLRSVFSSGSLSLVSAALLSAPLLSPPIVLAFLALFLRGGPSGRFS